MRGRRRSLRSTYLATVIKCSSIWTGNDLNLPWYTGPVPDECLYACQRCVCVTVIHRITSESSPSVRGHNRRCQDFRLTSNSPIPVVNQVEIIFVYQVKNFYMTRLTLLTYLLGFGTALLRTTLRVELLYRRQYSDLQARRVPILFALWHGRMFLPIDVHRHTGIGTMASKSRDGEIITRWLENNGYLV